MVGIDGNLGLLFWVISTITLLNMLFNYVSTLLIILCMMDITLVHM